MSCLPHANDGIKLPGLGRFSVAAGPTGRFSPSSQAPVVSYLDPTAAGAVFSLNQSYSSSALSALRRWPDVVRTAAGVAE
jgi:hypothetical protein